MTVLFSHIAIGKLKIGLYKDDHVKSVDFRRREKRCDKLESECLEIRSGEFYLETIPQLLLQFNILSITDLGNLGKNFLLRLY